MDKGAFKLLHGLESIWWYRGRTAVVREALRRVTLPGDARILDFGAGYGGMQKTLAHYGEVYAFEPEASARKEATLRGYVRVFDSPEDALQEKYDLIALFDVLEHIEDDGGFLRKAHDALRPGGMLLITVPAMPFLWSTHDVTHHHFRRYTSRTLLHALTDASLSVPFLSFWNMLLFAPAALARLLGRSGETSFHVPRIIDQFLYGVVRIETYLMRLSPLPFGISLIALARKKDP
ncbi:MAG: class I SAM-dependent methyltransferase [Minisyncoccia bacterium]